LPIEEGMEFERLEQPASLGPSGYYSDTFGRCGLRFIGKSTIDRVGAWHRSRGHRGKSEASTIRLAADGNRPEVAFPEHKSYARHRTCQQGLVGRIVKGLAGFFLLVVVGLCWALVRALINGVTIYQGVTHTRRSEPFRFWLAVIFYAAMAAIFGSAATSIWSAN
jgi:hypothetical protein